MDRDFNGRQWLIKEMLFRRFVELHEELIVCSGPNLGKRLDGKPADARFTSQGIRIPDAYFSVALTQIEDGKFKCLSLIFDHGKSISPKEFKSNVVSYEKLVIFFGYSPFPKVNSQNIVDSKLIDFGRYVISDLIDEIRGIYNGTMINFKRTRIHKLGTKCVNFDVCGNSADDSSKPFE